MLCQAPWTNYAKEDWYTEVTDAMTFGTDVHKILEDYRRDGLVPEAGAGHKLHFNNVVEALGPKLFDYSPEFAVAYDPESNTTEVLESRDRDYKLGPNYVYGTVDLANLVTGDVLDYKTGKSATLSRYEEQITFYATAVAPLVPNVTTQDCGILRTWDGRLYTRQYGEMARDACRENLKGLLRVINSGEETKPKNGYTQCKFCPVSSKCKSNFFNYVKQKELVNT